MTDQHKAFIERVGRGLRNRRLEGITLEEFLERELAPLLAAGQAMREKIRTNTTTSERRYLQEQWDAALEPKRELS